jgi:hypothetical protein
VNIFLDRKIKQADLDPDAPSLLSESVAWFRDVLQPLISYIAPEFACDTTALVHQHYTERVTSEILHLILNVDP